MTRVDLVLQLRLLGEQLVEVGVGLAHRVADLFEAVEQTLRLRDAVDDVAEHVLVGVELAAPGAGNPTEKPGVTRHSP